MLPAQQAKNGVIVECNKTIAISKPIQWALSEAKWELSVPIESVNFEDMNNIRDEEIFDIVGWVINAPPAYTDGKIQEGRLAIENGQGSVVFDLLRKHASLVCKKGDSIAAKGVTLNTWQGDRTITTKRLTLVRVNVENAPRIDVPRRLSENSPRKRALRMVSDNVRNR